MRIEISSAAVAAVFSSSWSPTSPGESRVGGDAGTDDDGNEHRGADELGNEPARRARVASAQGRYESAARRAARRSGTTCHIIQRPRFSPGEQAGVGERLGVMADRRLRLARAGPRDRTSRPRRRRRRG